MKAWRWGIGAVFALCLLVGYGQYPGVFQQDTDHPLVTAEHSERLGNSHVEGQAHYKVKDKNKSFGRIEDPTSDVDHSVAFHRGKLTRAYKDQVGRVLAEKQYNPIKVASDTEAPELLDPSMEKYISRLRVFVDEYFEGLPSQPFLNHMLDNLAVCISPPLHPNEPMRKKIISSAKGGLDGVDQNLFPAWSRYLGPVGWDVEVVDDEGTDDWFDRITEGNGTGTTKWRQVWEDLSRPVLKSDMIRCVHSGRCCGRLAID